MHRWVIWGMHLEDSSNMDHLRLSSAYVKQLEKPRQTCWYHRAQVVLYLEARLNTKVLIDI